MPTETLGEICPRCAAVLYRVNGETPWCPDCEWNLDARHDDGTGRRSRLSRRLDALAFDLDARLAGDVSGTVPGRPNATPARLGLVVVSVILAALVLALLAVGVSMVVLGTAVWKVIGIVLAMLAIELRPRLPRLDVTLGYTTSADQPELFAILDAIADTLRAPRLSAVVVDESFDATCGRYGLRRRRILTLGLPLWASLSPPARVALLAHQIGHLVARNPSDGLLAQPLLATFGNLARVFDPHDMVRRHQTPAHSAYDGALVARTPQGILLFEWIANLISAVVFTPLHWLFQTIQLVLRAATARSRHRAEYYADALAYDLAGSAGLVECCQTLLLHEQVSTTARRWLRVGADVDLVYAEAAATRIRNQADVRRAEQRSMRAESSLFADHPPTGRRLRVARSWPQSPGRLAYTALDFAAVDAQLGSAYRRIERALSHLP